MLKMTMHSSCSTFFILSVLLVVCFGYQGDKISTITGCPMRFAEKCHCGPGNYRAMFPDKKVFITNCTNTGFTDASILEYVPTETEVLIINGNHFPSLPWNILGIWNEFTNLAVIDLTNNGIKEIPGKAFHKVSTVRRLILNHNDIYIVSGMSHPRVFSNFQHLEELHLTNAFTEQVVSQWYLLSLQDIFVSSNLKKLKKLHLEQNEIWKISNSDLFCPLTELMDLHLADNQLTDINFTISCLPKLRYLDLEYNKMTNMRPSTMKILDEVFGNPEDDKTLNIKGNPFRCDCYMDKFFKWFRTTKVNIANKNEVRCFDGYPKHNSGIRFSNVQQLDCEEEPQKMNSNSNSGHAVTRSLLGILIFLTTALIVVLLWINRVRVHRKMSPLFSNLTTTMQYSTIEKEEQAVPPQVNV